MPPLASRRIYSLFTHGWFGIGHGAGMIFRGIQLMAWLVYLAGSLLILDNSISDYRPGGIGLFISQKGEIGSNLFWRTSLYVHIIGGMLCLFAALPQFSTKLISRFPSIHRIAGRIYGASVLLLVCPTGFHLALFAKGGIGGKLGFLTLTFAAFYTTLAGWRAVLPAYRDMDAHRAWMTRSFALASSAVSFRIYHIIGYYGGFEENTNYVVSLWISLLGNLAIAELLIHRKSQKRFHLSHPSQLQTDP